MEKCTYCGKGLGSRYSFSYGVPGVKQVFSCNRHWCHFWRAVSGKSKQVAAIWWQELSVVYNKHVARNQ